MPQDLKDCVTSFDGGVRLMVKAKPGTARPKAPRLVDTGNGKRAVEIAVTAIAEDGKANEAIQERLVELLNVRKKDIEIRSGTTSRLKLIEISGDPQALQERLKNLF